MVHVAQHDVPGRRLSGRDDPPDGTVPAEDLSTAKWANIAWRVYTQVVKPSIGLKVTSKVSLH